MAEELALARAVIQVEGDATQLVAAMASGEKALNDFSRASKENIGKAVASLAGLGDEAAAEFEKLSSASKRAVTQLALQTGRLQVEAGKLSADTFRQLELVVKGTSATIAQQYVGALSKAADDAKRLATEQGKVASSTAALNATLGAYDATQRNARVSANQLRTAYAQLPAQITDVVTSLASGIPAYLVLIQQGGQIKDAFGGIGNAARALVGLLTPLRVVIGATAAAFTTLAVAYFQGRKESDEFRKAILLSGNAANTTVGQLSSLAGAVSNVVGTQGKAAEVITQLVSTGQITSSVLGTVAEAVIRLEQVAGVAADKTVAQFAKLATEPTKAALDLNKATGFLTVSVFKQIEALENAGDAATAAAIAQAEFANVSINRAKELEQNLGSLERAWNLVANAAKKAWDRILDVGREQSPQEKLKEIEDGLRRAAGQAPQLPAGFISGRSVYLQSQQVEAESLREVIRLQQRANDTRQDEQNLLGSLNAFRQREQKYIKEGINLDKERAEVKRLLNLGLIDEARAQEYLAAVTEAYNKSLKKEKAPKEQIDIVQQAYENLAKTLNDELIVATVELQVAQQNLTAEQAAYLKIVQSSAWKEFSDGQRQAITTFYEQIIPLREATKAERDRQKAIEESNKAIAKAIEDESKRAGELALQNQALEDEIAAIGKTKEELAQLEAQRLRNNAAALEGYAISQQLVGASEAEVEAIRRQVAELQKRANLVLGRAGAEAAEEARKANEKAADDAYNTWKETIDDISRSLADGIIDGGKSAARALQNLFNNLVLRPIIQAALQPLVQGVAAAFGFLGPGAAAAAGGGQSGIQTAISLASTANTLNTSLSAFSAGLGASLGKAAVAAGNAFGSTALTQFGTGLQGSQLAAGLQGPTTVGAGGATGAGAATAPYITAAAGIAAGVLAGRAISGGYAAFGSQSGNRNVNLGTAAGAVIGSIFPVIGTALGAALGGIIGGVVNRAFGRRAPQIAGQEIVGTFREGQFSGDLITNVLEKGGWFRSDKWTQLAEPIVGDLDKALDEGGKEIAEIARKYGAALGLPVEQLANVSTNIKVKITENVEENNKAIEEALSQYAKLLFEEFADELEPLRLAGENISDTIERVGGAIIAVNDILANIGQEAIALTVAGGQAATALTELFGGAQGFAQATTEYYTRFFDESQRIQNATTQLGNVFKTLNLTVPTTKDQFVELVNAQDLTTESGRQTFAALISIAGIFDDVTTAAEKSAQALRDAIEAFRERFRTPEQQRATSTQRIASELIDLGVLQGTVQEVTGILTRATRDNVLEFVESFVTLGDVSDETKIEVANLAGALVDLKDEALDAADAFNRDLRDAIRANIGAFQTPEQRRLQPFIDIQQNLADVGIDIDLQDILNASKEDILTYAKAIVESGDVSNEAKLAVVEAAGALGTLRNEADQLKLDDILAEIGDVDVLKGKTKSLSEQYLDTVSSIDELERGLAELTGTVDQSIQEILSSLLQTQKALTDFRQGLSEQIEEARLRTLSPEARIQALRDEEARLFAELRVSSDPVATAQKLQSIVLQRIREEANLRAKSQQELVANAENQLQLTKEARDAQIDAIEAQIDALERLKDLADDIAQFTGSLRFSDISPLNYEDQLNAARQLFETTLSAAERGDPNAQGNLVGNARAFLDEARAYYASSGAYSAIFSEVTGALDALGLTATQADPQIAALESQIETLKNFTEVVIDTSAEEVAGLTAVRDALDVRITENTEAIKLQTELARQEIDERKTDRDRLALEIQQRIETANKLQEKINNIDLNLGKLVGNAELAGAAPT